MKWNYLIILLLLSIAYTGCVDDEPPCEDNDTCTVDSIVNGECTFTPVACNDNDPCTADACVNGSCTYTPITCPDTAVFQLDIKALHNDNPFVLGTTYQNAQNYNFNIELLRFYLSHLVLTKTNGEEVEVKDVDFLDFEDNHSTNNALGERVSGTIPAGNYTSMRFAIGVDSIRNVEDPAVYPSSHPLSIYTGSHWNWSTGYIFLKLEGRIDSVANGNASLTESFLYHTGTTPLYSEIFFEDDFTVAANTTYEYRLKLDVNRFFYSDTDTLDATVDNFTHTLGNVEVAERVTNLFTGAFIKR